MNDELRMASKIRCPSVVPASAAQPPASRSSGIARTGDPTAVDPRGRVSQRDATELLDGGSEDLRLKRQYGFPQRFITNYAKNTVKHLTEIVTVLTEAGAVSEGLLS
jgi:hypothetical protein